MANCSGKVNVNVKATDVEEQDVERDWRRHTLPVLTGIPSVFMSHRCAYLPQLGAISAESGFLFYPWAGYHPPLCPFSPLQVWGSGEFLDVFSNIYMYISHRKGQWYKSQNVYIMHLKKKPKKPSITHTHAHTPRNADTFIFTQSFLVTLPVPSGHDLQCGYSSLWFLISLLYSTHANPSFEFFRSM